MARNRELEAAILADIHDRDAHMVYADWLQSQGDPRGELIALALVSHASDEAAAVARAYLAQHARAILGSFAMPRDGCEVSWAYGHLHNVTFGWPRSGTAAFDVALRDLEELLHADAACLLHGLYLTALDGAGRLDFDRAADVLEEVEPHTLRELVLGYTNVQDLASTATRMPRSDAVPNLRYVLLRGDVSIGDVDLPRLETCIVQTERLSARALADIARARWPNLERLEIWLGDPDRGATAGLAELQPILDGVGLPNLRNLALRDCAFSDELVRAIAASPILGQLTELDLSRGNLTARGVATMMAARDRFERLDELDLSGNAVDTAELGDVHELGNVLVDDPFVDPYAEADVDADVDR